MAFISRLSVVNIHEDPDTHLPTRGRGTILLAKNRQGELGHVRFMHNEGVTSFWDDTQPACVRKARAAEPKPKGKGPSSNADGRYAAQGAGDGPHRRGSLRLPHATSLGEGLRGAVPVPRRAASLLPRLPGEEHREVLQLRRGRRTPIRLVCHMEGCGFEEAVRLLARKYNIEVEETAAAGRERRRDEREALLLANASFASGLLPGHPVGTTRTEEDRHGLEETYCGFGVGLCPPDVPQSVPPLPRPAHLPDTHHRGTGGRVRRTEPYPVGEGAEIRQLPRQSRLPQGGISSTACTRR